MADPSAHGPVPRVSWRAASVVAVCVLAGLAGLAIYLRHDRAARFAVCPSGLDPGPRARGGPFDLTNPRGEHVTDAALLARGALLVSFGRTGAAGTATVVRRNLAATGVLDGHEGRATPVFVTLDPAQDTAQTLAAFAAGLPPGLVALRGPKASVDRLAASFGLEGEVAAASSAPPSFLVLPGYGAVARFPAGLDALQLVVDARCFIAAAQR